MCVYINYILIYMRQRFIFFFASNFISEYNVEEEFTHPSDDEIQAVIFLVLILYAGFIGI